MGSYRRLNFCKDNRLFCNNNRHISLIKLMLLKKIDIIQSNVMESYFKNKIKLSVNNNKDINKINLLQLDLITWNIRIFSK